jgi:chitinase
VAVTTPGQVAAYVDVTLDDEPEPPAGLTLLLAFVTAGRDGCTPTWGGSTPLDDPAVLTRVRRWRAAGHELRVSLGGERGTDLAVACGDERQLAAAYRQVVTTLAPAVLDLDVEGPALADAASVHRRSAALRLLQADAAGHPVRVAFSLPATTAGLPAGDLALLDDAHAAGVSVDALNAMTMNYGQVPADPAATAITVASAAHDAMARMEPDADSAALWRRVWVTPMIGRNDVAPEVFTLADADRLATLARARGLGGVAYWSLARDRPCPSTTSDASSECSGVDAPPGAFTAALSRVAAR